MRCLAVKLWFRFSFWLFGVKVMPVSQGVLDKINVAEDALQTAKNADGVHEQAMVALTAAQHDEQDKGAAALDAHTAANGLALDAIAALKTELGIA